MGLLYVLNHWFLLCLTEFSADKMCTSLPQMWHQPCGARMEPEPVMNCVFAIQLQYVVLGLGLKVINLNILPESKRNELKYSLKIAFMFLSIILKFQVLDINILLGIRKKAKVFDGPWSANLVLGPRLM